MGRNASSKQICLMAVYQRKAYLVLIFEGPTLHLCYSNCFLHLCYKYEILVYHFPAAIQINFCISAAHTKYWFIIFQKCLIPPLLSPLLLLPVTNLRVLIAVHHHNLITQHTLHTDDCHSSHKHTWVENTRQ